MAKRFYVDQYVDRILAGDRVVLSRAITLTESTLSSDQELAQEIINKILPHTGSSVRIGITGAPGVGKSTFIEELGKYLIETQSKRLAVLAIDPSSKLTGGSILGDKTRMSTLATSPSAYIRPSPAGTSLGGVTHFTREAILLCEAAGFNVIIVETVGVGQSETAVYNLVDYFLLLLQAGAGDELQAIKKGIMEMADALVITKADGDNLKKSLQAKGEYQQALYLFPKSPSGYEKTIFTCSALNKIGINQIWEQINTYILFTKKNGYFNHKRTEQNLQGLHDIISHFLMDNFFSKKNVKFALKDIEEKLINGKLSPYTAASELIKFT